jgi:DNA polymerase-4
VDEAFLDVTGSRALFGDGPEIARRIKQDIRSEIGLTGSAGVAPSKFVAKIASDLDKPDGLTVVSAGDEAEFLAPLPLGRMWRVGPKARVRLRHAGLRTIGDLAGAGSTTAL